MTPNVVSCSPEDDLKHVMEMSANITQIRELQSKLASTGLLISSISHGIKGLLNSLNESFDDVGVRSFEITATAEGAQAAPLFQLELVWYVMPSEPGRCRSITRTDGEKDVHASSKSSARLTERAVNPSLCAKSTMSRPICGSSSTISSLSGWAEGS